MSLSPAFEDMIRQGTRALGDAIDRQRGRPAPDQPAPGLIRGAALAAVEARRARVADDVERRERLRQREATMHDRVRRLCAEAAVDHDADYLEVIGRCRKPRAHAARAQVYRQLFGENWSASRIGRAFKRDHTTILHALRGGG